MVEVINATEAKAIADNYNRDEDKIINEKLITIDKFIKGESTSGNYKLHHYVECSNYVSNQIVKHLTDSGYKIEKTIGRTGISLVIEW